jgi:hypothetical protein
VTPKKPIAEVSDTPVAPAPPDVALIHGLTPDGQGLQILRARENRLELGAIRPLREGAPITGEVVTLRPRANFPALCDVETHYKPALPEAKPSESAPALLAANTGPAQVATDEYRRNWDAIWSKPAEKAKLSN